MGQYVILFPADDEAEWEAATEAERQATFDVDLEFGQQLAARGGAVTGGAGLTHTSNARTLTRGAGSEPQISNGPYRSGAEQLTGFFIVSCGNYDALLEAAAGLVRAHPVVEIRPVTEF